MKFIKKLFLLIFASQLIFGSVQQVNAMDRIPKQLIEIIKKSHINFQSRSKADKIHFALAILFYLSLKYIKYDPPYNNFFKELYGKTPFNSFVKNIIKFIIFTNLFVFTEKSISLTTILLILSSSLYFIKQYFSFDNQNNYAANPNEQNLKAINDMNIFYPIRVNGTKHDLTPLMYSSANSSKKEVKSLLENKNIKLDQIDANGCTALIHSVIANKPENTKLLLFAGANPYIKDRFNKDIFTYIEAMEDASSKNIYKALLEKYDKHYESARKELADAIKNNCECLGIKDINKIIASYCI